MASRGSQTHLGIFEIYLSVQGESTHAGRPCVFVRTSGCGLRCTWCDTPHAYSGGTEMSIEEVLDQVRQFHVPLVELTGGEPMEQKAAVPLMQAFLSEGMEVLLETGGHVLLKDVPKAVRKIVDFKAPGSGMAKRNAWENVDFLELHDEIKLVIQDRQDYEWAREEIQSRDLSEKATVLLSPVFESLAPRMLVEWMLEDRLPARLNLQQHKYVWDPKAQGV